MAGRAARPRRPAPDPAGPAAPPPRLAPGRGALRPLRPRPGTSAPAGGAFETRGGGASGTASTKG